MLKVNEPKIGIASIIKVVTCLMKNWISGEAPIIYEFENRLKKKFNVSHAISVSNGSDALDLCFAAIDLKEGDEVILPTFTIISCVAEIVRRKAVPVFVDSSEKNWNMDISSIQGKLSSKTKAVLVVHTYGLPTDIISIQNLLAKQENKIFLIEDAAEAHGQTINEKPCGSFGDLSILSFYSNKFITSGEGGVIFTNSEELNNKIRKLKNLYMDSTNRFVHEEIGWNSRLSAIQAAVAIPQIKKLNKTIKRKRYIASKYREYLKSNSNITFQDEYSLGSRNIYWVVGILINPNSLVNSKVLRQKLLENEIETRPFFYPLHLQPVIKRNYPHLIFHELPIAEELYSFGLYLPNSLSIKNSDIRKVCRLINKYTKNI